VTPAALALIELAPSGENPPPTPAADPPPRPSSPSAECLGLSGPFLLVVPIDQEATAIGINQCPFYAFTTGTQLFYPNPWHHRFGRDNERIFANPLFANGNDWYLFDVSSNVGIVEVGFLNGLESPTIVLDDIPGDQPAVAQDRIVYKVRHEYEASIRDFRGAYKGIVP